MQTESDKIKLKQAKWQDIISLSQRMLTLAVEYDWDAILPLEKKRKKLLIEYFEYYSDLEVANELIDEIQQLIKLNEQLIDIAKRSQHGVRDKFQLIQQGKKAKKAYENWLR